MLIQRFSLSKQPSFPRYNAINKSYHIYHKVAVNFIGFLILISFSGLFKMNENYQLHLYIDFYESKSPVSSR